MTDIFENGTKLPLIDEFYTLQGEGFHTGKAAYFIRIGGCDIGCSWCDTKISWKADLNKLIDVDDVIQRAVLSESGAIVVTGGEPSSYDLDYLCRQAKKHNIKTFIETSGNNELTGEWDWICLSPKPQSPPVQSSYDNANELKIIIQNPEDFIWAEKCAEKVNQNCILYLQPEWSKHKTMTKTIVNYIKTNIKWKISVQLHKYIKIP